MADRQNPPPGFTVENAGGQAGWVTRNPNRDVVGVGWSTRKDAVKVAWDAADALARAERAYQPGWFAAAGDHRVGGPYGTRGEAEARLARLADDGTFHVVYGQRAPDWTFTEFPPPAGPSGSNDG